MASMKEDSLTRTTRRAVRGVLLVEQRGGFDVEDSFWETYSNVTDGAVDSWLNESPLVP